MRSVLAIIGFAMTLWAETVASVQIGKPAPDFEAVDSFGKSHRLSDYRGQEVILEWTNHECPFVPKHYESGNIPDQQEIARREGVVWLSIISSAPGKQGHVSAERANELTRTRYASPSAVLLDPSGEVGRLYRAKTTPQLYLLDTEGKLVYMGGIDSTASTDPADIPGATQYVTYALGELRAGKRISRPLTRPYGCPVKY